MSQILQSGVASTAFSNVATAREQNWHDFVAGIPECADTAGGETFECLRSLPSNSTSLFENIAPEAPLHGALFPWVPTVDEGAEGGLYPDFPSKLFESGHYAKVPILGGTCLDEGKFLSFQLNEQVQ